MKPLTDTTEKIKGYQNLIKLLQKNESLNHIGEYKKSIVTLANNLEELERLDTSFQKDFTQVFNEKEEYKNSLISNLKNVAGLLQLSLLNEGKRKWRKIDFLSEDMTEISAKRLFKATQKTISLANKLGYYSFLEIDNFSPKKLRKKILKTSEISHEFGLTQSMVKQLEDSANEFVDSIMKTGTIMEDRFKSMKRMKKLFKENDKIIEKKIDKMIGIFEGADSSFNINYANLRPQLKENLQVAETDQS